MVGCGLACPGGAGVSGCEFMGSGCDRIRGSGSRAGVGGGLWKTHTIWGGGGVATRDTGP